ncbi:DUF4064 domain-containing protein [Jeotgalibacillus marinus]|uniref:DUF4064 domain-containing protein n=1 Tax=Jeotgalibacillus marinus TaxID=86667 RepID=A0ABV3Q680_9BACL
MKRTAEIILTVIGVVINVLMIAGAFILKPVFSDDQSRMEFEEIFQDDPVLAEAGLDPSVIFDALNSLGVVFIIAVMISTILSIIAIVVVRGNRKPNLAGGLLIASTVVVGLGTFLFGWLPALLFLIAGIMCFARKPKQPEEITYEDEMRPL